MYWHIATVYTDNRFPLLAVGATSDHVHLLVLLSNMITIAQLTHRIKGSCSRFVNGHLRPAERFAWQDGYGVSVVSASHKDRMLHYIRNQKLDHTAETRRSSAERGVNAAE